MKKLWGGRFQKTPEKWVDEFGASIHFDKTLVKEDIAGSLAHASMLEKCGILTEGGSGKNKGRPDIPFAQSGKKRTRFFSRLRRYSPQPRKNAH